MNYFIFSDTFLSQEDLRKLIDQCLCSLEQCATRFPQNYKALYRLTHFYLNNKSYKSPAKGRQLMLTEYLCADSTVLTGLFCDRKNNNFFNVSIILVLSVATLSTFI